MISQYRRWPSTNTCAPFLRVSSNVERLPQAMRRCHSVRRMYPSPFLSFQDAVVATDSTVYLRLVFVIFNSASLPTNPINLTELSYIEMSPFDALSLSRHTTRRARVEAAPKCQGLLSWRAPAKREEPRPIPAR